MAQTAYSDSIKLVVFGLSSEEFGIEITKINSIIRMEEITEIPYAAEFIEGIINYRGRALVVIDLRKRFGLPEKQGKKEDMRIIVLDFHPFLVGMVVDYVSEVLSISYDNIEPVPDNLISLEIEQEYLLGVGNLDKGERLIILLDLGKVFSEDELEQLGVIFSQENQIKKYLEQSRIDKKKAEEQLRLAKAQQKMLTTGNADAGAYNENLLTDEEYREMERKMIRKLALRDVQQELGIDLDERVSDGEEVIYVDDESQIPEEDDNVEYVYVDEDGNEIKPEELEQLKESEPIPEETQIEDEKSESPSAIPPVVDDDVADLIAAAEADLPTLDAEAEAKAELELEKPRSDLSSDDDRPVSNDEVADIIAAVQAKKAKENQEKSPAVESTSDDSEVDISDDMLEDYRRHLKYNTKKELIEFATQFDGIELDMDMLKREMLDALIEYIEEHHPQKILNYCEE